MKLIIAEKPSVANAIAPVVGATARRKGYTEGNGYVVSWCYGHLVGLSTTTARSGQQFRGHLNSYP